MEEITIYKFQLEAIKEALRVTANIHESRNKTKQGRTCHDRMVTQAEKYAENALLGKKETIVRYPTRENILLVVHNTIKN